MNLRHAQEQATFRRKLFAPLIATHGAAIDAELDGLDRAGLVARLKAEGVTTLSCHGHEGPVEALLVAPGTVVRDRDIRALVYDALLLKAASVAEPEPTDAQEPRPA